jgi:hypothetical protein
MGNTKTSKGKYYKGKKDKYYKGKKGKKGGYPSEGGPVYVVLERECAMDLFLALAQALGAPIDKKPKKKDKGKKKEKGKVKNKQKGKGKPKGKGPKGPKVPGPKVPGPKVPGPKGPKASVVATPARSTRGAR